MTPASSDSKGAADYGWRKAVVDEFLCGSKKTSLRDFLQVEEVDAADHLLSSHSWHLILRIMGAAPAGSGRQRGGGCVSMI